MPEQRRAGHLLVYIGSASALPIIIIIADPWRYAALSIECVASNFGDLFNDRGISKKPEKHA